MLKRFALSTVFFVTFFFLFTVRSGAQWSVIHQFPSTDGYISASWFFNPQVGIIGFHWNVTTSNFGMVMRTTDGGKTWTPCTVPALTNVAPQVSDIWFSDSVNGWLTWFGGISVPMLWRTTDGGITWTANGLTEPFNGAASV